MIKQYQCPDQYPEPPETDEQPDEQQQTKEYIITDDELIRYERNCLVSLKVQGANIRFRPHHAPQAPARYLPISLNFQPICIDKPCIGQINICPVDDECDSVKQCVEHAKFLRDNPDVAEHNRKIITQHDAAIARQAREDEREKVLDELDEWAAALERSTTRNRTYGDMRRFIKSLRSKPDEHEQGGGSG